MIGAVDFLSELQGALVKPCGLGVALLLFTIYFAAPFLTGMHGHAAGNPSCCEDNSRRTQVVGLILHTLAFTAGMTAALIGISLGG